MKTGLVFACLMSVVFTSFALSSVFVGPADAFSADVYFSDFNGDGMADMAVRHFPSGDVKIFDCYYQDPHPRLVNGDFETGTRTGWTRTGTAFNYNPVQSNYNKQFLRWQGKWYINSYVNGNAATGTLTSSIFKLTDRYVDFRIAGYGSNYVSLHLASNNAELSRVYVNNGGWLTDAVLDGNGYVGQEVYIKVVDSDAGGPIAVDFFRVNGQETGFFFSQSPSIHATAITVPDTINWGLYFADINGDGRSDVINHNKTNGDIFVHYNNGSGFSTNASLVFGGLAPVGSQYRIFFADIDGDGLSDFWTLNRQTNILEGYRNTGGGFASLPSFIFYTGTVPYPFSGQEILIADMDGDGMSDLIYFNQTNSSFEFRRNIGNWFSSRVYAFPGLPERYEHQYFLADFNRDGKSDLAQIDLRNGEVSVYSLVARRDGNLDVHQMAFMVYKQLPRFLAPSEGRQLISDNSRSVSAMMFYEIDHDFELGDPSNGWLMDNGWFYMNPNHPNMVPEATMPEGEWVAWRTTTPILGLYQSKDPKVIKQHAYWMRAMGVDAVLVDWTNLPDWLMQHTLLTMETYDKINEFVPPKLVIAFRMQEDSAPFTETQRIANLAYSLYSRYPSVCLKTQDGTTNKDKPLLVAFTEFGPNTAWKTTGPPWTDSRFNMRFMNGYLLARGGLTTREGTSDWYRFNNDNWPYWSFVEVASKGNGYYRNLYRRLPGTAISELAPTWIALYRGDAGRFIWDGQLDVVDGKYLIERYTVPFYSKPPLITFINRWAYPIGWYLQPQEGLSLNASTMIEPSVDLGFSNLHRSANILYDLRKLVKKAPGKPLIIDVANGKDLRFSASNYPLEYRVSADAEGIHSTWQYIDVNQPTIELPSDLRNLPFYLKVRNSFGESEATRYGYQFADVVRFCSKWLDTCTVNSCQGFDFDGNGILDIHDFAILTQEWLP